MIYADVTTGALRLWGRVDRRANGLAADLGLYALSAAFAAFTATSSTLPSHRAWGAVAWVGYAVGGLVAVGQLIARANGSARLASAAARGVVTVVVWVATALLPMLLQCVQRAAGHRDRAQEEVLVVEQGGARLLDHGSPYLSHDAILALPPGEQVLGYLPYQPGMALFGLPRAWAGGSWWTDARVWFALVTLGAIALAVVALRLRRQPPADPAARDACLVRAAQLATVVPVCALTLATGGDDIPVLALCLLALALCIGGRYNRAGLAIGLASALKLFAWPVAVVLLVHAVTQGWRTAARFAAFAVGLPALFLVPAQLVDSGALIENLVRFPLGQGAVSSPAQSPFPGHLIASALPAGRLIAAALLVAAGLAIAVRLARRPPRTAAATAVTCGYGLLAAILLMPSTRFGYLLYPIAFFGWAPVLRLAEPHLVRTVERAAPVPANAP